MCGICGQGIERGWLEESEDHGISGHCREKSAEGIQNRQKETVRRFIDHDDDAAIVLRERKTISRPAFIQLSKNRLQRRIDELRRLLRRISWDKSKPELVQNSPGFAIP